MSFYGVRRPRSQAEAIALIVARYNTRGFGFQDVMKTDRETIANAAQRFVKNSRAWRCENVETQLPFEAVGKNRSARVC